eukprot:g2101.t1
MTARVQTKPGENHSLDLTLRFSNEQNDLTKGPPTTVTKTACSCNIAICRNNDPNQHNCSEWSQKDWLATLGSAAAESSIEDKAFEKVEALASENICGDVSATPPTEPLFMEPLREMLYMGDTILKKYLEPWEEVNRGDYACEVTDWFANVNRNKCPLGDKATTTCMTRFSEYKAWAQAQCIQLGRLCVGLQYTDMSDARLDRYFAHPVKGEPCPEWSIPLSASECGPGAAVRNNKIDAATSSFFTSGTWIDRKGVECGQSRNPANWAVNRTDGNVSLNLCLLKMPTGVYDKTTGTTVYQSAGTIHDIIIAGPRANIAGDLKNKFEDVLNGYRICKTPTDFRHSMVPCSRFYSSEKWRQVVIDGSKLGGSTSRSRRQCNLPFTIVEPEKCEYITNSSSSYPNWQLHCLQYQENQSTCTNDRYCEWNAAGALNQKCLPLAQAKRTSSCAVPGTSSSLKDRCMTPMCSYVKSISTKYNDCTPKTSSQEPMCKTIDYTSDAQTLNSRSEERWGYCRGNDFPAWKRAREYVDSGFVTQKKSDFAEGGDALSVEHYYTQRKDSNGLVQPGNIKLSNLRTDHLIFRWLSEVSEILFGNGATGVGVLGINKIIRAIFHEGKMELPLNMEIVDTCRENGGKDESGNVCFQVPRTPGSPAPSPSPSPSQSPSPSPSPPSGGRRLTKGTPSKLDFEPPTANYRELQSSSSFTPDPSKCMYTSPSPSPSPTPSTPAAPSIPSRGIANGESIMHARLYLDKVKVEGLDSFSEVSLLKNIPNSLHTIANTLKLSNNRELKARFEFSFTITPSKQVIGGTITEIRETQAFVEVSIDDVVLMLDTFIGLNDAREKSLTLGRIFAKPFGCLVHVIHDMRSTRAHFGFNNSGFNTRVGGIIDPGLDTLMTSTINAFESMFMPAIVKAMPAFGQGELVLQGQNYIDSLIKPYVWVLQSALGPNEKKRCVTSANWPDGTAADKVSLEEGKIKCELAGTSCKGVRTKLCSGSGSTAVYCECMMCSSMPYEKDLVSGSTATRPPTGYSDYEKTINDNAACPALTANSTDSWLDTTIGDLMQTLVLPNVAEEERKMIARLPNGIRLVSLKTNNWVKMGLEQFDKFLSTTRQEEWVTHSDKGLLGFIYEQDKFPDTKDAAISRCRGLGQDNCQAIMCNPFGMCAAMKWNQGLISQRIERDLRPECVGCQSCEYPDGNSFRFVCSADNCTNCNCNCNQPQVVTYQSYTVYQFKEAILGINGLVQDIEMDRVDFEINKTFGPIVNPHGGGNGKKEEFTVVLEKGTIGGLNTFTKFEPLKVVSDYVMKNQMNVRKITMSLTLRVTSKIDGETPVTETVKLNATLDDIQLDLDTIVAIDKDKMGALRLGSIDATPTTCLLSVFHRLDCVGANITVAKIGTLTLKPTFQNPKLRDAAVPALEAVRVFANSLLSDSFPQMMHHIGRKMLNSFLADFFATHLWESINDNSKTCTPMDNGWPLKTDGTAFVPSDLTDAQNQCLRIKECKGVRSRVTRPQMGSTPAITARFDPCKSLEPNYKYRVTTGERLGADSKYKFSDAQKADVNLRPRCKFPFVLGPNSQLTQATRFYDCTSVMSGGGRPWCYLEVDANGQGSHIDVCEPDGTGTDPSTLWKVYAKNENDNVKCDKPKEFLPNTPAIVDFQTNKFVKQVRDYINPYISGPGGKCPLVSEIGPTTVLPQGCKDPNVSFINEFTKDQSGEAGSLKWPGTIFGGPDIAKHALQMIVTYINVSGHDAIVKNLNTLTIVKLLNSDVGPHTIQNDIRLGTQQPSEPKIRPPEVSIDLWMNITRTIVPPEQSLYQDVPTDFSYMGEIDVRNHFSTGILVENVKFVLDFILEASRYEISNLRLDQIGVPACIVSVLQDKKQALKLLKLGLSFDKFNFLFNCKSCQSKPFQELDQRTKRPTAQAELTVGVNLFLDYLRRQVFSQRSLNIIDTWITNAWGTCMVYSGHAPTYHEEWTEVEDKKCQAVNWPDGTSKTGISIAVAAEKCIAMGASCVGIRVSKLEKLLPNFQEQSKRKDGSFGEPCSAFVTLSSVPAWENRICTSVKGEVISGKKSEAECGAGNSWTELKSFQLDRNVILARKSRTQVNDLTQAERDAAARDAVWRQTYAKMNQTALQTSEQDESTMIVFGEFTDEQNLILGGVFGFLGLFTLACLISGIKRGRDRRLEQKKMLKDRIEREMADNFGIEMNAFSKMEEEVKLEKSRREKMSETWDQPSLFHHPATGSFTKYFVPFMIAVNVYAFYLSHVEKMGSVRVDIAIISARLFDQFGPMDFSIIQALDILFKTKTWPLFALILVFSVLWPYLKLILMLYCWFAPPGCMSHKSRGGTLVSLDMLGKWSLVDIYIILMFMIAFNVEVLSPTSLEIFPKNLWYAKAVVKPDVGLYFFLFGVVGSLVTCHFALHSHRDAVAYNEQGQKSPDDFSIDDKENKENEDSKIVPASESKEDSKLLKRKPPRHKNRRRVTWFQKGTVDMEGTPRELIAFHKEALSNHIFEVSGAPYRLAFRFIGQWIVTGMIIFAMFLFAYGVVTPCFYLRNDGLVGLAQSMGKEGSDYSEYSLYTAGMKILEMKDDRSVTSTVERLGIYICVASYFLFSILVPMLQLFMMLILWMKPMTLKGLKLFFSVNEIVGAWSALPVLLVSLGAAIVELKPVSRAFFQPLDWACSPLSNALKETLVPFGLMKERHAQCYEMTAGLPSYSAEAKIEAFFAIYFILIAIMMNVFVHQFVLRLAEQALHTREARVKGDVAELTTYELHEKALKKAQAEQDWRGSFRQCFFALCSVLFITVKIDRDEEKMSEESKNAILRRSRDAVLLNKNIAAGLTKGEIEMMEMQREKALESSNVDGRLGARQRIVTRDRASKAFQRLSLFAIDENGRGLSLRKSGRSIAFPNRLNSTVDNASDTSASTSSSASVTKNALVSVTVGNPVGQGKDSPKKLKKSKKKKKKQNEEKESSDAQVLPPGWTAVIESGKVAYYWNEISGKAQLSFPGKTKSDVRRASDGFWRKAVEKEVDSIGRAKDQIHKISELENIDMIESEKDAYKITLGEMTTSQLIKVCDELGVDAPMAQDLHTANQRSALIEELVKASFEEDSSRRTYGKRMSRSASIVREAQRQHGIKVEGEDDGEVAVPVAEKVDDVVVAKL